MNEHVKKGLRDLLGDRCVESGGDLILSPMVEHELVGALRLLREAGGRLSHGVSISRSRMRSVGPIDEKSAVARAEAGVPLSELERSLSPRGLTLGPLSPGAMALELGAFLEGPHAGLRAIPGGRLEGLCLAASALLPDGRVYHSHPSPRRAAGPDLTALLLGGEGRFGLVLAATVRCAVKPEASRTAAFSYPGTAALLSALRGAIADGCWFERARAHRRDERVLLEVTAIGTADGVEGDLATVSQRAFARGGRATGRELPAPEPGEERELSWADLAGEIDSGRALELYRLCGASVIARGAQGGMVLRSGAHWPHPFLFSALAEQIDPTAIFGGPP
ncbi:MAG: FAD-binding oxidoreductase [Myxococcales bacterium]|nr:FAD-binding oxidoreductase [Myxococcales bacterium]